MTVLIRKVTRNDMEAFAMLWQFYQYHQSAFDEEDVDDTGRFDIDDGYLKNVVLGHEECDAYMIFVDDEMAGFATVEPTVITDIEMPELSDIFVLPKYRNRGVAHSVVKNLMLNQSDQWHVAIHLADTFALQFWETMFLRLEVKEVKKVEPSENQGFHEYVVTNL